MVYDGLQPVFQLCGNWPDNLLPRFASLLRHSPDHCFKVEVLRLCLSNLPAPATEYKIDRHKKPIVVVGVYLPKVTQPAHQTLQLTPIPAVMANQSPFALLCSLASNIFNGQVFDLGIVKVI